MLTYIVVTYISSWHHQQIWVDLLDFDYICCISYAQGGMCIMQILPCCVMTKYICDWMLENRLNCHTRPIYSILLAQLMATLVHYIYIVPLPGLVDWSTSLHRVLLTLSIHDWDNETHGGCYMEGMGLKFTPVIGRHLLRHSSMFGPMAGTSGTHS